MFLSDVVDAIGKLWNVFQISSTAPAVFSISLEIYVSSYVYTVTGPHVEKTRTAA
jgi:hypothetical protein